VKKGLGERKKEHTHTHTPAMVLMNLGLMKSKTGNWKGNFASP